MNVCCILGPSYYFFLHILKDYQNTRPEFTVLDPHDAIQQVHNRQSVLKDVADLNLYYGNLVR